MSWTHTGYAQRVHFGRGTLNEVRQIVRELGGRRVLLVTTEGRLGSPEGRRLTNDLGSFLASVYAGVRSHVPLTTVAAAVGQAHRDAIDTVVSFGGGSCADLGKAVCHALEKETTKGLGVSFFDRAVVPHVAVPTTYSGAELTPFFGVLDESARRKTGAGGPTIAPAAAVYDPDVTLSTPPQVSAATGMNALAHCIEAAYSPVRTPEAEVLALAGVARIVTALPWVVDNSQDLGARTEMLTGAVFGGRCLQNASMGAHHGLAQLVGGYTGIAHGLANAVLLAHVVAFNADAVPNELAQVAVALGVSTGSDGAAAAIDALRERLDLPARLSECGVGAEDLDVVAHRAETNPNVVANPKRLTADDVRAILKAAL